MLATGFMIFLGTFLLLIKLPRRLMLRALKYDLVIDVTVSVIVLMIHFGTFRGAMAATIAGLLTSVATSSMKRLFGYVDGNLYHVGHIRLSI